MANRTTAWLMPFAIAALTAGCAAPGEKPPQPAHPVEGVRKVVDSLSAEVRKRVAVEPYRGLPVVVHTTSAANAGIEPMIAELLRTRLVDGGVTVEAACTARCMEIVLQEFAIDSPKAFSLTPGQVLTVAGSNIPFVGGLIRNYGEQARERERAANRATGVFVTFAAREDGRYASRAHIVVILSAGEVALEQQ